MTWTQVWTNVTNLFRLTQTSAILLCLFWGIWPEIDVFILAFWQKNGDFTFLGGTIVDNYQPLILAYFSHRTATEPSPHQEAKSFVTLYLLIYKLFRFLCPHSSATFGKNSGWLPVMVLASLKPFKCLNVCIYRRWLLIKQIETGNVVLSWGSSGQTLTVRAAND